MKTLIINTPEDLTTTELVNLGKTIAELTKEGNFEQVFAPKVFPFDQTALDEARANPDTTEMYIGKSALN